MFAAEAATLREQKELRGFPHITAISPCKAATGYVRSQLVVVFSSCFTQLQHKEEKHSVLYFPSSVMTHVAFFFFFPSGVTNLRAAQSIASAGKKIKQKDIKKKVK